MKIKKLVDSFNYAINGIIHAVRTQRNMRIHLIVSLIVLTACFIYDIKKVEFLILAITISMVITAELINTAIESVVDLTTNFYHPLAKIAKNTAAGGVLVTAINALLVGYLIFFDKIVNASYAMLKKVKVIEPYTIFIILVIVSLITVGIKAYLGEGTPLKGGMPSGHSAISFSLATAIALMSENPIIITLSFLMAIITAQSRVDSLVHSVWEVIVGAILGSLVTFLIFRLLV